MNRKSEGKSSSIPHLAKNQRDMKHPSFVWKRETLRVDFLFSFNNGITSSGIKSEFPTRRVINSGRAHAEVAYRSEVQKSQ
jgi:hypothetical protein